MTGRIATGRRACRGSGSGASPVACACALLLAAGGCQTQDVLLGEVEAGLTGAPDAAGQDAGATEGAEGDSGGEGDAGSGNYSHYPELCDPRQCMLPPDVPIIFCSDGTVLIPYCVRGRDGRCEWQNGECGSWYQAPRDACGGCGGYEYCDVESCGRYGDRGVCRPRPDACNRQYEPVCGCDGRTYGNACLAAIEGVSIAHDGSC